MFSQKKIIFFIFFLTSHLCIFNIYGQTTSGVSTFQSTPDDPNFLYQNNYINEMNRDSSLNTLSVQIDSKETSTSQVPSAVTDDRDLYSINDNKEIKKPLIPVSQIIFFIFVVIVFIAYRYKMKKNND